MSDHCDDQQHLDDLLRGADPLPDLAADRQIVHGAESARALEVLTSQSERHPFQRIQSRHPGWAPARSVQASRFRFVGALAVLGLLGLVVVTQTSWRTGAPPTQPSTGVATTIAVHPATTASSTRSMLTVDPPKPSTTQRPADVPSVAEPEAVEAEAETEKGAEVEENRASTEAQTDSSATLATIAPAPEEASACIGEGPTVLKARDDYAKRCDLPRVDCDQFGSAWRCSSEQFGDRPGAQLKRSAIGR